MNYSSIFTHSLSLLLSHTHKHIHSHSPSLSFGRGYVYSSQAVEPGWVVWINGRLLHRPLKTPEEEEEGDKEIFCTELDTITLKVHTHMCTLPTHTHTHSNAHTFHQLHSLLQACGRISLSCPLPEGAETLHLMSDGLLLYWLYHHKPQDGVVNPITGDRMKQYQILLQRLQLKVSNSLCVQCLHVFRVCIICFESVCVSLVFFFNIVHVFPLYYSLLHT